MIYIRYILVKGFLNYSHYASKIISSNIITESKTKTKKNITCKPATKGQSEIYK